MNKLIRSIKALDIDAIKEIIASDPAWLTWAEPDGKNALHYLAAMNHRKNSEREEKSVSIMKLLLNRGMDINAVHHIPEERTTFPATPLWYAYAKGRNDKLYRYLLAAGANPEHCMFAIVWNNDVTAATLFKKYGAETDPVPMSQSPLMAAIFWKRWEVAEWFLRNNADVNRADFEGNASLHHAVMRRYNSPVIAMLLKYGADPDQKNKQGESPRTLALRKKMRATLSLFGPA